jgi:hypothetical protein
MSDKAKAFVEKTGLMGEIGCGINTSQYLKDWHGVSPMCEVVLYEFGSDDAPVVKEETARATVPLERQLSMF